MSRQSKGPDGFTYVPPTLDEIEAYKAKHRGHRPAVYRVTCDRCALRMWGSGLGIASHRRGCPNGPSVVRASA